MKTTSTKSKTKSTKSFTERVNTPNPGRPRPMTTKAGYTQTRRRYNNCGELCW